METSPLVGTWRLDSIQFEDRDTGERTDMYGPAPVGHIMISGDGHTMVLIAKADRKAPASAADESALFKSMMAYAGTYRLEGGNQFITTVSAAWHPAWIGSDQARFFEVKGSMLAITTAWQTHPNFPGRTGRGVVMWHRTGQVSFD
jgi:Lipocalin-like domain